MPSKNVLLQNDPGTPQQEAGFGFNGRFWFESTVDGLTAHAGGGRASATLMTSMFNRVSTVATVGDSCVLPPAFQGLCVAVHNDTANALQMYSQGTDTINTVAGATGVQQMNNSIVWYTCHTDGKWIANGIGTGYAGANLTYSFQEGLTAFAGGGQQSSGASLITASTARFGTVATAGDSGTLMTAAAGLVVTVINNGANIMNLYPASGDQINNGGANNPIAIPAGGIVDLYTTIAGAWHAILSPTAPDQARNTAANTTGFTATGAQLCGGQVETTFDLTGTLGGNANVTLPTVAQVVAAMTVAGINPQAGQTFEVNIIQRSAANTWTIVNSAGNTWTLNGTMTLGNATKRKFYMTLTTLTAGVLQSVESSTVGAS